MGSVQKRTQAGTTSWLARWRDPTGTQRKRSFPRRIDAERFLSTVSADLVQGNYIDPSDPTLFRDYAEQWRAAQVHRPTTRAHVETNLRRHAYPTFGDRRLSTIRPGEVQAWVARLTEVLSPATVQVNHGLVAAVFKAAMRDRLVGSSPCEGTKLPKKLPKEVVPLAVGMVDAMASAVPQRYRALVVLAAGTGLRQGECFGVVDDRLDLAARTLRVDQITGPVCAGQSFDADESACKPDPVPGHLTALRSATIHLGLPSPAGSCGPPAGSDGPPSNACAATRFAPGSLLTLLRVGFTEPPRSPGVLVVSYTTVSPLPRAGCAGRSVLCGTVPRVAPGCR